MEIQQLSDVGQNFLGVWLDKNSENTDNKICVELKRDLENIFDCLQIFKQPWDCIGYLHSIENGKILFIVSHEYASIIKPIIEEKNLPQIYSMYIFCSNQLEKDSWNSKSFKNLRCSFECKDGLMTQLKDDINVFAANNKISQTSTTLPSAQDIPNERITNAVPLISIFNGKSINNSIQHLNKDSIWFIRYQLLFEILLKLEKSTIAAKEMVKVCKTFCKDEPGRLKQIEEFEKDAENAYKSIYWYTKASFIIHLLNKACGSQDIATIYPFRLFITNLHYEIVKLHTTMTNETTVFRGKLLPLSTLEKLKKNKNGLVAMIGFLSTTRDEEVAKLFSGENPINEDRMAVLFKLNIDPKIGNKPYADIPPERHAMGPDEKELLFSIGSVWRIIDVKELKDDRKPAAKMWCVELTLSNEDDKQWIEFAAYLKREIGDKYSSWTLGDFLTKAEQYEQAEKYYRLLEYASRETGMDLAAIYNRIAYVRYERKDDEIALDYLGKAMGCAPKDSEVDVVTELNQKKIVTEAPLAFLCLPGLRRRFEAYNVKTKYLLSNPASISIIENNIGLVRYQQGHCEDALQHFNEALKILLKSELSFLPEISAIYNNIGCVQYSKENYDHAVDNFDKAMITLSKLDSLHPWIREYTENYQAASDRQTSNKPKRSRAE